MPTLIHRFDTPASTQNWQPINDGVMGGVSVSRMRFDMAGHAVFEGEVSLENNGGFASVRASELNLGCAVTVGYVLTVWVTSMTYRVTPTSRFINRGIVSYGYRVPGHSPLKTTHSPAGLA